MNDQRNRNDEASYRDYGEQLKLAIEESVLVWLERLVECRAGTESARSAEAHAVFERVAADALDRIDELIHADLDAPLSGPLELLRQSVRPIGELLDSWEVTPANRDLVDAEMRPDDRHDLGPITFLDIGQGVHEAGIAWGAAKAHLHLSRRRRPGL